MQLSRIKEMSEKRKKEWIEAIDELKKDYRRVEPLRGFCPLCHVVVNTGCGDCLWKIIEGCDCGTYEWGDGHIGIPEIWMIEYFEEWKTHRLKMLDIWKKIITIYKEKKMEEKIEDSINRFGARMEEVIKAFEVISKAMIKDLKSFSDECKKAIEEINKNKKGGNDRK